MKQFSLAGLMLAVALATIAAFFLRSGITFSIEASRPVGSCSLSGRWRALKWVTVARRSLSMGDG